MRLFCLAVSAAWVAAASSTFAQTNLVANGDFETGTSQGWTAWRAPWGAGETRLFNDTTAGRTGNYCLRMSTVSGSSFGVYQTVNVTPGCDYRLELKWKATLLANPNWWEIMLIDGPYDYAQMDLRPDDEINKMYSYDSPENPPTGSFDWVLTPTLDGTPTDLNSYYGVRQATGTQMTIGLKLGCLPGTSVVSWFDDVKLFRVGGPGDFDRDGDADMADFTFFQACFNGPDRPAAIEECESADADDDGDVDLSDFTTFQVCFNGADVTPACPWE